VAYSIEFTSVARDHFSAFTARQRALLRDGIVEQLTQEPRVETRRRRQLRPNALAGYRLRVRDLRVYYDVIDVADPKVLIQAFGIKVRNRVFVAGEEIDL
jgi:mRNA-degrading endonuclease RelE of RelBE toxin-antitoxin system